MLASALEARGWSVWWDRKIIAGQSFDQVIERELGTAKSIVVLWSKASISSEWVKNEAAVAAERGILVPALIDSVKLPLEFRRKQTADLVGWDGDTSHWGFQALCDGVAASITGVAPHQMTTPPLRGFRWNRRWIWTMGAIVAVAVLVFGAYRLFNAPPYTLEATQPDPSGNPVSSRPAEKAEKDEYLKVWANSVEGVPYQNKTSGDVQVNFKASGRWLAIPEDVSESDIPKTVKGHISPNGDPNFFSNDDMPCRRVPLGALIVRGENRQCKAYGEQGSFELSPGEAVYFLMNDVSSSYEDNEGYVDVQLSISKKSVRYK